MKKLLLGIILSAVISIPASQMVLSSSALAVPFDNDNNIIKTSEPVTPKKDVKQNKVTAEPVKQNDIDLSVSDKDKKTVKLNDKPAKITGSALEDQEKIKNVVQIQKKIDVDDIKMLWEATVERNSVIKFALRKLTAPPEERRIHSSVMAKSVSTLISGASMMPGLFGMDTYLSAASLAGGNVAQKVISDKSKPKNMPVTDTELIQLAGVIDDLQDKLIRNYYEYKSSIESLKSSRANLILQNKNYSEALKSGNNALIVASSAAYDQETYNELKIKQQVKILRLELERLAGTDTVAKLNLSSLVSINDLNKTKDSQ